MPKIKQDAPNYAEGPKNARVVLVGQNPGQEEVKQNRPFVGRSGKFLDKILREKGIDRARLYITAVVKKPTPGNRKPTAGEIRYWMPRLVREIRQVNPEIVVLLGRVAWETPRLEGIDYIETYHPAAAMRFPKVRQKFEQDMEILKRKIGKRQ